MRVYLSEVPLCPPQLVNFVAILLLFYPQLFFLLHRRRDAFVQNISLVLHPRFVFVDRERTAIDMLELLHLSQSTRFLGLKTMS